MKEWITAYRCGFCKHIYYNKEFRFDKICPKCGHKNYLDNPWPGDHLEYVLIRKRLFHGWETKEVELNMQRKCRIKYTAPKFESDLLKLTSEDEPKILELCKDYLAGTWIIVEYSKVQQTKYRQLKVINSEKAGEFYITTYLTDKKINDSICIAKENIENLDASKVFSDYCITTRSKKYINLDSLNKYNDLLSRTATLENHYSLTCSCSTVTAYSTNGQPIASFDGGVHITYE